MSDLVKDIDKYLSCIPDDLLKEPNGMVSLIVRSKQELEVAEGKVESLEKIVNKADVYFSTNWYATNLPIANESKALESLLTDIDEALAQHNIKGERDEKQKTIK